MGGIMNQVNTPQKTVWAHQKLETTDKAEIIPYLRTSVDVNETLDDLLNSGDGESNKVPLELPGSLLGDREAG